MITSTTGQDVPVPTKQRQLRLKSPWLAAARTKNTSLIGRHGALVGTTGRNDPVKSLRTVESRRLSTNIVEQDVPVRTKQGKNEQADLPVEIRTKNDQADPLVEKPQEKCQVRREKRPKSDPPRPGHKKTKVCLVDLVTKNGKEYRDDQRAALQDPKRGPRRWNRHMPVLAVSPLRPTALKTGRRK